MLDKPTFEVHSVVLSPYIWSFPTHSPLPSKPWGQSIKQKGLLTLCSLTCYRARQKYFFCDTAMTSFSFFLFIFLSPGFCEIDFSCRAPTPPHIAGFHVLAWLLLLFMRQRPCEQKPHTQVPRSHRTSHDVSPGILAKPSTYKWEYELSQRLSEPFKVIWKLMSRP